MNIEKIDEKKIEICSEDKEQSFNLGKEIKESLSTFFEILKS